jgi:hypothetical protein
MPLFNTDPLSKFLPGQWLDLYFKDLSMVGRYTIISTPGAAAASTLKESPPYVEILVQNEPIPQVQRLWVDIPSVVGMELAVRIGGSFVWPPTSLSIKDIRRVVFVASGMGAR